VSNDITPKQKGLSIQEHEQIKKVIETV